METKKTNGEGKANMGLIVVAVLLVIIFFAMMPVMLTSVSSSFNAGSAASMLEDRGYFVATADEYSDLMVLLQAVDTKADAAVANAEAAALTAQDTLDTLKLHTENEGFLFPAVTNVTVTLTAPATPNTWGTWAEIAGNDTVTFSSRFADGGGYITQITGYEYSVADKLIIIEIAYDDDGTDVVGKAFLRSDWTYVVEFNSAPIPEDATIYYRMMSSQANETIKANFKYYYN